jgi:hypothetical protein
VKSWENWEGDVTVSETDLQCHELLLRLAGQLPDKHLWRYRDWLAGGAPDVLARSLPKTLVRERIALSDADQRFLAEVLIPLGANPAAVHAVLPGPEHMVNRYTFTSEASDGSRGDSEVLVLGATLRGRQGVREVRSSWRRAEGEGSPKRVLVITATTDFVELTGEIQRILRALGEPDPRVEVLPPDMEPPAYHMAAFAESVLVCSGADSLVGHRAH